MAGGGVLLRDCYELIDQIVLNFGVPEKVYSLNTNMAPDKQQRLSITEDTAVVTMKFSDTLICNLLASRTFGPDEQMLRLYGKDRNFVVSAEKFTIYDSLGKVLKRSKRATDKVEAAIKMFENLGNALDSPETKLLWADGNSILNNMAVIESAYLSAKTGMPEEPSRILGMIDAESTGIWSATMKRIV
jgi:predicted dehydrogenase